MRTPSGWVGGWVGWIEENEAVRMSYWTLGVGWVGGWEETYCLLGEPQEFFCGDEYRAHTRIAASVTVPVGWVGGWVRGLEKDLSGQIDT